MRTTFAFAAVLAAEDGAHEAMPEAGADRFGIIPFVRRIVRAEPVDDNRCTVGQVVVDRGTTLKWQDTSIIGSSYCETLR